MIKQKRTILIKLNYNNVGFMKNLLIFIKSKIKVWDIFFINSFKNIY